jgi:hypothetical protein
MHDYRLLAYGGTSYSERKRLGNWPVADYAAMGDRYALADGALSYGVGLAGGSPFLIARLIQNEARRGGYPYTLLFDPGQAAWLRFEWNGAALLMSLLNDERTRASLFDDVEMCDEALLTRLISALAVPSDRALSPNAEELRDLWA